MSNQPLSEQIRIAGETWADLEGAAHLLEESKSSILARKMAALGDIPIGRAERDVKASDEWEHYIKTMCDARLAANKAKIRVEYLKARYWEFSGIEATKRAEIRAMGATT